MRRDTAVRHLLIPTLLLAAALGGPARGQQPVVASVEIEGRRCTLDLHPHSNRAAEYRVLAQVAGGAYVDVAPGPVRTLRGTVLEAPGSIVAGSLGPAGLRASIRLPGRPGRFLVEPRGAGLAVAHADDAAMPGRCGAGGPLAPASPAGAPGGTATAGDPLCAWIAQIAFDADYEYFAAYGSVAAVEERINAVVNLMNVQYESQVGITHDISAIIVRTDPADPYTADTIPDRLEQFRTQWNTVKLGIGRDLAQLFTGTDLSGGVIGSGFILATCTDNAYSIVEDQGGLSCAADLSAHECGHNWGASHCTCPDGTMNAGLQCALNFTQPSIDAITAYRMALENFCIFSPCEPGCPGDSDGDLLVNVDDLNNVVLDWGTDGSAHGGDLSGTFPGSPPDGIVNVSDLNAVIVNWGVCVGKRRRVSDNSGAIEQARCRLSVLGSRF